MHVYIRLPPTSYEKQFLSKYCLSPLPFSLKWVLTVWKVCHSAEVYAYTLWKKSTFCELKIRRFREVLTP